MSEETTCVREELRGPVEASRVGLGDREETLSLPELQDQEIDLETLNQLFFDIEHAAEVFDVRLKGATTARALPHKVSLAMAREALTGGDVVGVQIRYRHGRREWCDTVIRTATGARVVRIGA